MTLYIAEAWGIRNALCTPGPGVQSGVMKDSMIQVYLGYRNIKISEEKNKLIDSTLSTPRPGARFSKSRNVNKWRN